jgi:hypothetical protein
VSSILLLKKKKKGKMDATKSVNKNDKFGYFKKIYIYIKIIRILDKKKIKPIPGLN